MALSEKSQQKIRREEQAFFGKISAGLSHEINNMLATIKEQAGLIIDYGSQSQNWDESIKRKITKQCFGISNQAQKAAIHMKYFNQFAHSADTAKIEFDVIEMLHYFIPLCERFTRENNLDLEFSPTDTKPLTATGHPFSILHTVHICLTTLIYSCKSGEKISIDIRNEDRDYVILFRALSVKEVYDRFFQTESLTSLLNEQNGKLTHQFNSKSGILDLALHFTK